MDRSFAVRKGSWTEEEDDLLRRCIEKYGEGKWRHVPLRAGLRRCQKSCRLRWLNYLRPNLKRGEFTEDEVDLLLKLHKLLGNRQNLDPLFLGTPCSWHLDRSDNSLRPISIRWSLIAGRLPGRTANDIKNFWNTRFNRRTINEGEEVEAKNHASKKNEVIKPRPWTFPKNSPWLLGSSSYSTSPKASGTNAGSTNHSSSSTSLNSSTINAGNISHSREMLSMICPILPSTGGSKLEQERDSFDEELLKGISSSISGSAEDMITSLGVEDLQPMIQVGNDSSFEEGSIIWDDDCYLDFNFWDTPVVEGELLS